MNAGVNERTSDEWSQREAAGSSARDRPEGPRVTTAAEIFVRYSKWQRLNQEVGETTKKNKLDQKNPPLCYF